MDISAAIKKSLLLFALLMQLTAVGQNLVPNASFEENEMCDLFAFWQGNVKYWYNPNNGSPDYYSACIHTGEPGLVPGSIIGGDTIYYQYPHSGDAYVGVYT